MSIVLVVGLLFVLLAIGTPVAFSLVITGSIG